MKNPRLLSRLKKEYFEHFPTFLRFRSAFSQAFLLLRLIEPQVLRS